MRTLISYRCCLLALPSDRCHCSSMSSTPDTKRRVLVAGATGAVVSSDRRPTPACPTPDVPRAWGYVAVFSQNAYSADRRATWPTGYVGKYVLEELKQRNYTPVALVRNVGRAKGPAFEGCVVVTGDVLEPATLPPACESAFGVISCLASRWALVSSLQFAWHPSVWQLQTANIAASILSEASMLRCC